MINLLNNGKACPGKGIQRINFDCWFFFSAADSFHQCHKSRSYCFLYTPEVQGFIERIQNQTGFTPAQTDLLQIDGTDVKGIYDKTWRFSRDNLGEFKNIAVDITEGKTSMAAGAALAAAVIPADICYVDTDNYLTKFRIPEPGSEYMRILEGPDTLLQIAR